MGQQNNRFIQDSLGMKQKAYDEKDYIYNFSHKINK